jgi:hypothetical protein
LYSCQAGSAAVAATQKAFRRAFSKWCCTIATKELSTPPGDIARPHHRTRRFSPDLSGPRGELSCTDLDIAVRIRELYDAFRATFRGGKVMMTSGVDELPDCVKADALVQVATFSQFTTEQEKQQCWAV